VVSGNPLKNQFLQQAQKNFRKRSKELGEKRSRKNAKRI